MQFGIFYEHQLPKPWTDDDEFCLLRDALDQVELARELRNRYPHELSGGMRQRVMIAMAIANDPDVIIADEPTTALDVTIQAQVLDVLKTAQRETGAAIILITHDLGVVADVADKISVMYAGRLIEQARSLDLYSNPAHPYTEALLSAVPVMEPGAARDRMILKGDVPSPIRPPPGCWEKATLPSPATRGRTWSVTRASSRWTAFTWPT